MGLTYYDTPAGSMTSDPNSANKVFAIPELLEVILLDLPPRSLFRLQIVARPWENAMLWSARIRKALGFQAVPVPQNPIPVAHPGIPARSPSFVRPRYATAAVISVGRTRDLYDEVAGYAVPTINSFFELVCRRRANNGLQPVIHVYKLLNALWDPCDPYIPLLRRGGQCKTSPVWRPMKKRLYRFTSCSGSDRRLEISANASDRLLTQPPAHGIRFTMAPSPVTLLRHGRGAVWPRSVGTYMSHHWNTLHSTYVEKGMA